MAPLFQSSEGRGLSMGISCVSSPVMTISGVGTLFWRGVLVCLGPALFFCLPLPLGGMGLGFLACGSDARGGSTGEGHCFLFLVEPFPGGQGFLGSGSVSPVSLRFVAVLGVTGSGYGSRSGLYSSLKRLNSLRQLVLTMMDLGSKATRCNPASVRTRKMAT